MSFGMVAGAAATYFGASAGTAALIGAGASAVGSSLLQSNAASDAADAQRDASSASIGEQRRQYDLTRSDYAPYRAVGGNALNRLADYYGIEGASPLTAQFSRAAQRPQTYDDELSQPLQMDPGYEFGLKQGQQALDRKTAAAGGRISGAALKGAAEYATNYATTGYNAAYQRRQDRLNRLASLAGIGQSATGASAAAGANATNAITGIVGSQGDAAAAGRLAQGNIWGGGVNQLGAIGQRWASTPSPGYSGSTGYTGGADPLGEMIKANKW